MSGNLPPHRFDVDPQCPLCRDVLLPVATWFREGIAFCKTCYDCVDDSVVTSIALTRSVESGSSPWLYYRGLSYFCPQPHLSRRTGAHLLHLRIGVDVTENDLLRNEP